MVRLVQGVARCAPIGMQHATNGENAQQVAQQPAQQPKPLPYENAGSSAQHPTQHPRNEHATNDAKNEVEKLRGATAVAETFWHWRITYPDGQSFEIFELPEPSRDLVERAYPGTTIEPIADRSAPDPRPYRADGDGRSSGSVTDLCDSVSAVTGPVPVKGGYAKLSWRE